MPTHHRLTFADFFLQNIWDSTQKKRGGTPLRSEVEGSNFVFFVWTDGTHHQQTTRQAISLNLGARDQ